MGVNIENFETGNIRNFYKVILDKLDFRGKRVLELGCGRGEVIKYAIEHGAIHYDAVDFSPATIEIVRSFIKHHNISANLYCNDMLEFFEKKTVGAKYDIVIIFDVFKNVTRTELRQSMIMLRSYLSAKSVIAINTPVSREDNYINLYTVFSLQGFMKRCGYQAITEAHFFEVAPPDSSFETSKSYRFRWETAKKNGLPLFGDYEHDDLEYAYDRLALPELRTFQTGNMRGLTFHLTDDYFNIFDSGDHDNEILTHMKQYIKPGVTVFDVGGFIGMSSLLFRKHVGEDCRIFCFEPNPWNFNRILLNLSHNPGYDSEISCFNFALGEKTEETTMIFSDSIDNGHSSTSQLAGGDGTNNSHETLYGLGFFAESVKSYTLDEFVETTGIIPNLIKVDIEGAEAFFIMGALDTLKKYRPTVYFELHSIMAATRSLRLLFELGYGITILSQEPDGRVAIACTCVGDEKQIPDFTQSQWLLYEYESLRVGRLTTDKAMTEIAKSVTQSKDANQELQRQIQESRTFNTELQLQISNTQTQLNEQQAHNTGLQRQVAEAQVKLSEQHSHNAGLQQQVEDTKDQLNEQQVHNAYLQKQLVEARDESEKRLADTKAESEKRLADTKAESEKRLADTKAESERQLADTKDELERQLVSTRTRLEKKLVDVRDQYENQLTDAQAQLSTHQSNNYALQHQVADSQARLSVQNASNKVLLEKLEDTKYQLGKYQTQNTYLIQELSVLSAQLEGAERQALGYVEAIHAYENSTSWRLTKPVRVLKKLFNRG